MILPSDYNTARAYGDGAPKLTPGGHVCVIRGARVDKARSGRDMLVIAFEISEGSEFDGYYAERYKAAKQFRTDASWPGVFRATTTNAEGKTNGFFKGLIEAIEASNPGFDFIQAGCDERKLQGKLVGFNFGEEEYPDRQTGELRVSVKPQYAVSAARVREGLVPPPRKAYDGGGYSAPRQFPQQTNPAQQQAPVTPQYAQQINLAQTPNADGANYDASLPF